MDGEAEAITRKVIEEAKDGNPVALRLCLERIMPARKDRPIAFALPPIDTPDDLSKATAALLRATAAGDLTPGEATEFGRLLDSHMKAVEISDLWKRLAELEAGR